MFFQKYWRHKNEPIVAPDLISKIPLIKADELSPFRKCKQDLDANGRACCGVHLRRYLIID